ncbi:MAG: DUF2336 domain-containing protein [Pseudomonadota bacterium]
MLLNKLEKLASDGDPYSKRALALRLSNLYLDGTHEPSSEEKELFSTVMFQVIDDLTESVVAQISQMLSRTRRISPEMAFRFASHDAISIARPMLEGSPLLSDQHMLTICSTQSEQHRTAVARRKELSEVVSLALAKEGAEATLVALADNDEAQFGKLGVAMLLERGAGNDDIEHSITRRVRNNAYLGELIRSALTDSLRQKIGDFAQVLDNAGLDKLTATAEEQVAQRYREERAMRLKAKFLRHKIRSNETSLETEMEALVQQGRLRNIMALLASWHSISLQRVERAFSRGDATPVIFLLKASDLKVETFERIEAMRCLFYGHDVFGIDNKKQAYLDLARADALKTVKLLQDRLANEQSKAVN